MWLPWLDPTGLAGVELPSSHRPIAIQSLTVFLVDFRSRIEVQWLPGALFPPPVIKTNEKYII